MRNRNLEESIELVLDDSVYAEFAYDLKTYGGYVNLISDAMMRTHGGTREKWTNAVRQVVTEEIAFARLTKAYELLDYTDIEKRVLNLVSNGF
jgi:hypothetical protein